MGYVFTIIARYCEGVIASIGAHLTVSISGIFYFGIPVMYALGAYAMVVSQKLGVQMAWSIIISLISVFVVSLLFVASYLRLSKDSFTVFTFMSILAFDALIKSWDRFTGGVLGIAGISRPDFLSTLGQLIVLQALLMILFILFEYFILKSWIGRALLGLKEDEHLTQSLGIATRRLGAAVIIVSSILAAIAGILTIWRIQFLDPSFGGIWLLIQVITVAILAVKPKVRWLALSVLFVVLLQELLRFLPLPLTVIGHLRILLYSILLIVIIKWIGKTYLPQKRFI